MTGARSSDSVQLFAGSWGPWMSFMLQGPATAHLADEIERAAAGALRGGAVFAFATKGGIERLLRIPPVAELLQRGGTFELVVGTDAITNADALLCLEENATRYGRAFRPYAFVHDLPTIFHPKFCWLERRGALRLITGSGNLTPAGLGGTNPPPRHGNWEALVSQELRGDDATTTIAAIREWFNDSRRHGLLLAVNDPEARSRGVANSRMKYVKPRRPARRPEAGRPLTPQLQPVATNEVLVRELPRTRPGQADIGREGLAFFGFHGTPKTVLLQHVGLENSLGPITEQRLFVNASRNYRLELGAITAHGYVVGDDDSRLILVAVKLDESAFRYTLVPVTDDNYIEVQRVLGPITNPGTGRQMRKREIDAAALRSTWPDVPDNLMPVIAVSVEDVD